MDSKASPYDIILEYQGADKLYIEKQKALYQNSIRVCDRECTCELSNNR